MFANSFVSSLVGGLCLLLGLSVGWGVMLDIGFVCLLVRGYVIT